VLQLLDKQIDTVLGGAAGLAGSLFGRAHTAGRQVVGRVRTSAHVPLVMERVMCSRTLSCHSSSSEWLLRAERGLLLSSDMSSHDQQIRCFADR